MNNIINKRVVIHKQLIICKSNYNNKNKVTHLKKLIMIFTLLKYNQYYLDQKVIKINQHLIILHNIQKVCKNNKNYQLKRVILQYSFLMLSG